MGRATIIVQFYSIKARNFLVSLLPAMINLHESVISTAEVMNWSHQSCVHLVSGLQHTISQNSFSPLPPLPRSCLLTHTRCKTVPPQLTCTTPKERKFGRERKKSNSSETGSLARSVTGRKGMGCLTTTPTPGPR